MKILNIIEFYYNKNSGSAKIKCTREGDVDGMKERLINELGVDYKVGNEKLNDPIVKLIDMNNNMNIRDIQDNIIYFEGSNTK